MAKNQIRRPWLCLGVVGVMAFAFGIVASQYLQHDHLASTPATATDSSATALIESFTFTDQRGVKYTSRDWRDKALVINFWATWCLPCVHEIPLLNQLQEKYREAGLRIIGVAVSEPDEVQAFLAEHRMVYPTMVPLELLQSIAMMRRTGNTAGVLPYTLFVDEKGEIAQRHQGVLKRQQSIHWIDAIVGLP